MVFDFFKKRAEEGIDQLSNIATKTGQVSECQAESQQQRQEWRQQ